MEGEAGVCVRKHIQSSVFLYSQSRHMLSFKRLLQAAAVPPAAAPALIEMKHAARKVAERSGGPRHINSVQCFTWSLQSHLVGKARKGPVYTQTWLRTVCSSQTAGLVQTFKSHLKDARGGARHETLLNDHNTPRK